MIQAFEDTLKLAKENGMDNCSFENEDVDYSHLEWMLEQIKSWPVGTFSEAKLGRWLGWAQACVVAGDFGTLDDMKAINQRNS